MKLLIQEAGMEFKRCIGIGTGLDVKTAYGCRICLTSIKNEIRTQTVKTYDIRHQRVEFALPSRWVITKIPNMEAVSLTE
jgi:hypothetical protein